MVNFIIDFVLRLLRSMMEVLSFSKHTITNTLNIYVKTNTGNTLAVGLDPKWDIKNVKEIVGPRLGLDPQDIRIIFAGKELHDSTTIEQCDLGQQSVLHVATSKLQLSSNRTGRLEPLGEGSKPLNETLIDLQLSDGERSDISTVEEREAKRAHFYVYCASPCKSLKMGKLRVRCSSCLSGAFTVDRDPQNWDDVLQPHRITGYCETPDCVAVCDGLHFAEFFFKCSDHATQGETDLAVPLYLIKSNVRDVPCLACTDISDPVLIFPCSSGHVTCLDCFRTYCSSQLRERQFWSHPEHGYTLPCPAGCPDSLITEVHHFKLLTEQQYAQYQRFGAEEFVLQAGGVLCPQPDCGMGILVDPDCKRVQCIGGCGFVFCRSCLQGYHIGECMSEEEQASADVASVSCQYNVDPSKVSQARWDEASKKTIKVMSKPCPKCRTATERDGGCMHMICTRPQCGFHWCWVCQTAWTRECMGNHWFG